MASLTLLASAARVASNTQVINGTSGLFRHVYPLDAVFRLDVTAAAIAAGDTLNVYVQHSLDDGSNWDDFVSFTQVLGNGGAKKFVAHWTSRATPNSALHVAADGALAAGVNQGPVGPLWRVKWVVASASAPSFTFQLLAQISQTARR